MAKKNPRRELRDAKLRTRYNEIYKTYTRGAHDSKHDMTVSQLEEEFFLSVTRINRILTEKNEPKDGKKVSINQ